MTGQFLTPLVTKHVSVGRKELAADLVYRGSNGTEYTVPAGFYSDGASVPRICWTLYPPFGGQYEPAAWVHDYLYAYAEDEYGTDNGHISRGEADGLFYEAMETLGFRWTGRNTIHRAVRMGGWNTWRKYRKERKERDARKSQ